MLRLIVLLLEIYVLISLITFGYAVTILPQLSDIVFAFKILTGLTVIALTFCVCL